MVLEMCHVSKKFKKGEVHDSLRDLFPALFKTCLNGKREASLRQNEFWALRDVSFRVARGEALGIIGSNGAGKSTILKLLTGVMRPTEGAIKTNGAVSALIEVGAGFHPDLTGRENIFLNGTILGMKKEQIKSRFDEIVDFSGLADFIDTPVKRYSSGMYARLGFSVAAHVNPDILIVDEVLSVGDYTFQNRCLERMKAVLNDGVTVIFVSHNLKAVSDLSKRAILLDHGKVVMDGPTHDVIETYYGKNAKTQKDDSEKEVFISRVTLDGASDEHLEFSSGSRVVLAIDVRANRDCRRLSVSISLQDDNRYSVFDTSSERLSGHSFSLDEGETKTVAFELELNLGPGTYHLAVSIYRYDIQKMYDDLSPSRTFFVSSDRDARGAANLYPVLVEDRAREACVGSGLLCPAANRRTG